MPPKRNRISGNRSSGRRNEGVLNTFPSIMDDIQKNLNRAHSKSDTRHDFDLNMANTILTTTINQLYGENIVISRDFTYTDYPPDRDPFTISMDTQVSRYQLNIFTEVIPYPILNGPVPKLNMKSFMGEFDGLRLQNTKIVTVSDNVSANSLLQKLNSQPGSHNVTEMVTISSIVDIGGRSVPTDFQNLFNEWWRECVDGDHNFTINLQDIGVATIPIVLNVERDTVAGGNTTLTVNLTFLDKTVTVRFDLSQTIGNCLMKDPNGAYILFSGKRIGNEFFEKINTIFRHAAVDLRITLTSYDRVLHELAGLIAQSTRIPVDTTLAHLIALFNSLGGFENIYVIGMFFLIAKLIHFLIFSPYPRLCLLIFA